MTARDEPERLLTSMAEAEMAKLPVAAGARQVVGVHVSPRRAAVRRFLRYRLAIVGVVILLAIILMAALAPLLTPWPPNWIDFQTGARHPPTPEHILGTDVSGRDVWARVLYGARTSLIVGFGAVALYLIIGTLLGLAAGYYGRFVDQGLMRFTDTIMAIPPLLLIIVFVAVLGPSIISVIVVIGLLGWPVTADSCAGSSWSCASRSSSPRPAWSASATARSCSATCSRTSLGRSQWWRRSVSRPRYSWSPA